MGILAGDWWMRNAPPILKGEENVEEDDLADEAVTTAKIAGENVTSECLSANALRRSVVITLPAPPYVTTTDAQLLSSSFVVFTPQTAIKVASAYLTPIGTWTRTTVQTSTSGGLNGFGTGTLLAGGSTVGTVSLKTSAGALTAGVPLTFTMTTANASVAAGTALSFALPSASSSGMVGPQHFLQIDYDTTA